MKIVLHKDFKEFVSLLNEHEVQYMLVGGYAVGFHGYPRYTGDLDIWFRSTRDNAEKLITILNIFGFSFSNLTVEDFLKEDQFIQLGYEPFRIDLISSVSGLTFDEAYKHHVTIKIEDMDVVFIGLDDLIKNKRASGRTKDMNDVENLEEP
jgi:hypothetical protein